jgi:replicative DNA helicase
MYYNTEAERSVIATLINKSEWFETAIAIVGEKDFYVNDNRAIFSVICKLKSSSRQIDAISIKASLNEQYHDVLHEILCEFSNLENNLESHLQVVKDNSTRRQMHAACLIINDSLRDESKLVVDLLSDSQSALQKVFESGASNQGTIAEYKDLVLPFLKRIKERSSSTSQLSGLASGYHDLDELTTGFQPADLIIIAARPSMGKTTFAMNIVENVAKKGGTAMVFSLEMPKDQLMERSVASIGRINSNNIRKGSLTRLEEAKLQNAIESLSAMNIVVDDQGGLTIDQMRARAIKQHRETPLKMIMVDYLQLMRSKLANGNKNNEITEISNGLKRIAKELNIPVIALSQLSRNLESRPDKRPINSDLRESGAIEQDADLILFVYRDEIYNPDTDEKGIAEIIIGKQRNGPLGTVRLGFVGHESRFDSIVSQYEGESEFDPQQYIGNVL